MVSCQQLLTKEYCLSWTVAAISFSVLISLYLIYRFSIESRRSPIKGAAPSQRPSVSTLLVCRLRVRLLLIYHTHTDSLPLPVDTSLRRNLYRLILLSLYLIGVQAEDTSLRRNLYNNSISRTALSQYYKLDILLQVYIDIY